MGPDHDLAAALLHAAVGAGTPILLACLGEVLAERAGVLNLGLEGLMTVGALTGFAAARATGDPWVGMLAAGLAAGLLAAFHALLVIELEAQQVAAGLALTVLGVGLGSFLGSGLVGELAPRFSEYAVPGLAGLPVVGYGLFTHYPPVWLALGLAVALGGFLHRTRPGLELQVVGDAPGCADAAGVDVRRVRWLAVVVGGALAGLGGAYLSLADTPSWMDRMTAGRGWIAVALVILAGWDPLRAVLGAWLFGGLVALQFRLQAFGVEVSPYLLSMLPYLATLLALVLANLGRADRLRRGPPLALGVPFDREERR